MLPTCGADYGAGSPGIGFGILRHRIILPNKRGYCSMWCIGSSMWLRRLRRQSAALKKSIHHFPARNPDSPISPSPDFPYFPMVFGFISGCLRLHVHLVGFLSIFLLSIWLAGRLVRSCQFVWRLLCDLFVCARSKSPASRAEFPKVPGYTVTFPVYRRQRHGTKCSIDILINVCKISASSPNTFTYSLEGIF